MGVPLCRLSGKGGELIEFFGDESSSHHFFNVQVNTIPLRKTLYGGHFMVERRTLDRQRCEPIRRDYLIFSSIKSV